MALLVNRSLAGGIAALLLAMGIGRFAYTPLLPAMQDATGLSDEGAGVIASINLAGYLVGALALTALPDAARGLTALRLSLLASVLSIPLQKRLHRSEQRPGARHAGARHESRSKRPQHVWHRQPLHSRRHLGLQGIPRDRSPAIEWSHLDQDENGDIHVGTSRLGYNTFYHALSVVQNKSRASVKRLMELAYHRDTTNVAGRCLWGMNSTVPDPADRAFLAGEVIKLLGLRSDDYMWKNGLRLMRECSQDHLPALKELAARDTLSKERRDALQQIIQSLQKPQ